MTSKVKDQCHIHKLTSSDLCLFLIRETKCCTCVIKGGRGHTVSAELGGHTSSSLTSFSFYVHDVLLYIVCLHGYTVQKTPTRTIYNDNFTNIIHNIY